MGKRILVNGASGRIGRAVTYNLVKELDDEGYDTLQLVGLNDPVGIEKLVSNFQSHDPVHGKYDWGVKRSGDNEIELNGHKIKVYSEKSLANIPFAKDGVQIVEECSGFFGDDKKDPSSSLSREFLDYGVGTVIQSYPAKSADKTIIMGVNQAEYNPDQHRIISNGSCTTKALASPLQVLMDYGVNIHALLMDTVHAATNSQNILESLDNMSTHKTGAAQATGEVIPYLKGKMDGLSFRVPTSDGSFANIYFVATYDGSEFNAERVNGILKAFSSHPDYFGRVGLFEGKEASSKHDIVGRTENGIVILDKTRVIPFGKGDYLVGLVSGYDNEMGPPADQVLLTKYIADRT